MLENLCSMTPQESSVWDVHTKKYHERYYFNTIVHGAFCFYGNLFYNFNNEKKVFVKQIPVNIGKYLTPRAIAY